MSKGTTIKDALAHWEKEQEQVEGCKVKACDAKVVKMLFKYPPIDKMDASLSTLGCCEQLSISSNMIEKIANLNGLKNLKILSLGRNLIKNLNGLEAVSDTLEELWISYNYVEKLKGIQVLKKLKVLYMSNNLVKDWNEFDKLAQLPQLKDLVFTGNPLQENTPEADYPNIVMKKLTSLAKLDGTPLLREEQKEDEDGD